MKSPRFLSADEVLYIHQRSIEKFGGSLGVRDRGLLESAVAMPAAQFGGTRLHQDVPTMAAAYLFHLCKNHPFVDGNKRISLAAAETFLILNGYRMAADDAGLEALALGVAAGSILKEQVTAFFQMRSKIPNEFE